LLLLTALAVFYLNKFEPDIVKIAGNRISLILAVLIPLGIATYLVREYPLSPPVYFAAVLISAYFGFRTSLLMTTLLIMAIMPMTGFDPLFPLIAISGSAVAALFTKGITRRDSYAFIIIMTAGTNLAITLCYGLIQKESWSALSVQAGYTAISGTLSVIAAIGIMPLFEMIFNAVSPLRLIELSQPGHPLLRRLFVEAPGSSQHSMMVANLADAAADAICANTLLARVGAYYHDIGKLENPLMFTENQQGVILSMGSGSAGDTDCLYRF
jgi:putative nucleotidyltransferase with HDIG domain